MKKLFVLVVVVFIAAACATAPVARTIVNSFPIDKAFEKVWPALIEVFAELNLPIMNMAKDSGLITTDWISFKGQTNETGYCDCGGLGTDYDIDRHGRFNVFIKKTTDDACELKVNAIFEHIHTSALARGPNYTDQCVSTGKLEAEIYKRVSDKMK